MMKRAIVLALTLGLAAVTIPAHAAARTSLMITADLADGAKPYSWSLTCDPVGGKHPNRKAACALLDKRGTKVFAPVPANAVCTEIYGGPERVRVRGTVKGKKVDATFTRSNGCEIDRYERAVALFTIPGTEVLRGAVTLDGQPVDATVIFIADRRQVSVSATAGNFAIRLSAGAWIGSASVGRSCAPLSVMIPRVPSDVAAGDLVPVIACRTSSGG